jgi:hypothetical protein
LKQEHRLRVFENIVMRKIFRPKREEDGSWRKLHNDELHNLYYLPNTVRAIKEDEVGGTYGTHGGRGKVFTGFWLGGPKGRDQWKDLGVGGRITLRWTLGSRSRWGELDLAGSG